jgi:hypothetical protein
LILESGNPRLVPFAVEMHEKPFKPLDNARKLAKTNGLNILPFK